eukprot:2665011-Rhodomonas_salina.1
MPHLYTDRLMQSYRGQSLGMLPPHPFAIANHAFSSMAASARDQSILVSGESGAGPLPLSLSSLSLSLLSLPPSLLPLPLLSPPCLCSSSLLLLPLLPPSLCSRSLSLLPLLLFAPSPSLCSLSLCAPFLS